MPRSACFPDRPPRPSPAHESTAARKAAPSSALRSSITISSCGGNGRARRSRSSTAIPLRYPASVTWSGGGGLAVVRGEKMAADARRFGGTKAVRDLETMELSGVRPGTVSVRVSSGGLTRDAEVRVEEAAAGSAPAAEPAPAAGG